MPTPILPFHHDPEQLSAEERARAIAALLDGGLHRLLSRPFLAEAASHLGTETSSNSDTNHLAVCGEKSVTVHAG